jgi:transcriptional regulator with XRE-family HTH domain
MSQPAYAKLEKPDSNPRTATLRKIARALGISFEELTFPEAGRFLFKIAAVALGRLNCC